MPDFAKGDLPAHFVSQNFRDSFTCYMVALCTLAYFALFAMVQLVLRLRSLLVPEFNLCQRKAYTILANFAAVYLFNSTSSVPAWILVAVTILYSLSLLLCLLPKASRGLLVPKILNVGVSLAVVNLGIHVIIRVGKMPIRLAQRLNQPIENK